jgi:hypothetical protein
MVAIVAAETVLLVVLLVLVAGLLRSHAEILRRLGPAGDQPEPGLAPPPAPTRAAFSEGVAAMVSGATPGGDAITLAFDGPGSVPTLLAFLTSGCSICSGFWETLGEPRLPPAVQTVIVTKGSDRERPARLRSLTPDGVQVVMSSQAWADSRVPGAPYFVLVDGGGVRGEGLATTWQALASLVSDAIEDQREAQRTRDGGGRARDIDETFAAAGIAPDDPSLYPGRAGQR